MPRPSFIFILIDDMGYADLSCYGGEKDVTPNIDRLAAEGVRFTQFYVGSPICSPSRTAFTTGQHPARWNINSFLSSRSDNERRGMPNWLDPRAPSLARMLKKAGYKTGHIGKWHMGGQRDVGEAPLISEYGFDETLTQFEGLGDRILPILDAYNGTEPRKHALGSDNLSRGEITWMDRSKVTGAYVRRAMDFIHQAQAEGKSFYLNLWPDDVHSPFSPPKHLRGDASKRQLYLGVLKAMDEQLAPLFHLVRGDPVLRYNTIVILSSDNGPEPGAGSAGPLRGMKGRLYEGGIRSPLIVWGPGYVKNPGAINTNSVLCALDFLPSVLGMLGVKLPRGYRSDGLDLSQTFLGAGDASLSRRLFWSRPPGRSGGQGEKWPDLAMREGDWKLLIMRDGSSPALYNLREDPCETNNLAMADPVKARRMQARLLAWWKTMPPSGRIFIENEK